jgi:uncharacterized protein (DUF2384 family)
MGLSGRDSWGLPIATENTFQTAYCEKETLSFEQSDRAWILAMIWTALNDLYQKIEDVRCSANLSILYCG